MFRRHCQQLGASDILTEAGIVVGGVKETIMNRAGVANIDELCATGSILEPLLPDRAIVQEVRISGEWYGQYRKGARVLDASQGWSGGRLSHGPRGRNPAHR